MENHDLQPASPDPAPHPDPLQAMLLDSRRRWQAFGLLACDIVFESDLDGRLTFVAPDPVLGWAAGALLGQSGSAMLAAAGTDPFRFTQPVRDQAVWLRDASGQAVCLAVSSAPLLDDAGVRVGTRGVGVNVTAREAQAAAAAAALRRGEVLDHILGQMRQEVLAPRMMQAVLDAVVRALGASGAVVMDLTLGAAGVGTMLHRAGADPEPILAAARTLLHDHDDAGARSLAGSGPMILACTASTRFGERAGLVVWRPADARAWDGDDRMLTASVTGIVRIVLEHEAIQRELARQARTDPLTGLLNRRAFLDEAARRIDRLDREGLPGTLLFVDLDRLKQLNDRLGHEAGDAALVLAAELLRHTVRPTDLVARLGGDEFALWLDGSDEMTAAERAEGLRTGCPEVLAHLAAGPDAADQITMSIGIACRRPGAGEELDSLLARADQAMYEVKHAGRGHWRVSQTGPAS